MNHILVDGMPISPSKIICIGRNYVDHIKELGNEIPDEMVVFTKPNSSISDVLASFHQEALHYEAELCFVVQNGRFSAVGLGLDLTKRALQSRLKEKGLPWERAKSFDGAAVFTSFVEIPEPSEELRFTLHIDGELTQEGNMGLMMRSAEQIRDEVSLFMTLEEGDVVMTGTPKGVGIIVAGSTFELTLFDGSQVLVQASLVAN